MGSVGTEGTDTAAWLSQGRQVVAANVNIVP